MKRFLILLPVPILFFINSIHAQERVNVDPATANGKSKDFIPASPNASSLGIFGQVPVGNYTGIPSINVPFYTMKYKDLSIPIGINYHTAAGNNPESFPGSVGLGWSLQAGGTITRIIKGVSDYELFTPEGPNYLVQELYNPTEDSLWSSDTSLNNKLKDRYTSLKDKSNPDEYYFNVNGMSGRFYLHHSGVFQVKSNQGIYLDIEVEVLESSKIKMPHLEQVFIDNVNYGVNNDTLYKADLLYKIVLRDPNGVKYTFGGVYDAIEFSRPGHQVLPIDLIGLSMHTLVAPISWNLTSVESPNKYKILLEYKRGFVVTKVGFNDAQSFAWVNNNGQNPLTGTVFQNVNFTKSTLMNVSYLSKIISPTDSIVFITNNANNQLEYPHDLFLDSMFYYKDEELNPEDAFYENGFYWYPDIGKAETQNLLGEKYSQIKVYDKSGNQFKRIDLQYSDSDTTRLKLLKVRIFGTESTAASQNYHFEYNPIPLPPYISFKTDHYGYYNGKTPYMPITVDLDIDADSLFNSKEPDTAFVQAELLKKITYPTGGYIEFEYEPNTYQVKVSTWPFSVVTVDSTKITGGVRIKKVTSYTDPGKVASVKKYIYTKNYSSGGTESSGVLAFQPAYYENYIDRQVTAPSRSWASPQYYTGTLTFKHWSTNPIFPMGATRGNHVTYSEVTELNSDSSFIVSKYKNYDNGYNDKSPVNWQSDNVPIKEFWKEDEGISMDLERGQVLSEDFYDSSKVVKKKNVYGYNEDTARFANNVRVLINTKNNLPFYSYRLVASLVYTYFPFLSQLTTYNYEGADSLVTLEKYEYNDTYKLLKKHISYSSKGDTLTTLRTYPFDLTGTSDSLFYKSMLSKGLANSLIEQEQQFNGHILGKAITEYSGDVSLDTSLILPKSVKSQYRNSLPELRHQFVLYNDAGCVLSDSVAGGLVTCYVWGYGNAYPIARIINGRYDDVKVALGGQVRIDSFAALTPSDMAVNEFLDTLRYHSGLSAARITTYTFRPLAVLQVRKIQTNERCIMITIN